MGEITKYQAAQSIMGKNFIGEEELKTISSMKLMLDRGVPDISISQQVLEKKKKDYLLILGIDLFCDEKPVTIRNMIHIFGKDSSASEPCFYNQDWYEKEDFIDIPMKNGWYLIKKDVFEDSRAVQPDELKNKYSFPLAVSCVYAFFTAWMTRGIKLWYHNFIWCSDTDHNGDRIYVGKYHDVDGVNKNGFSIHRHLGLRDCYGCIDSMTTG